MNNSIVFELVGAIDPWDSGVGFFVPIFSASKLNSLFMQETDEDGRISSFVPLERETYKLIKLPQQYAAVGDEMLWTFVFGVDDILVGQGEKNRDELKDRLNDPFFGERPLLAMEAAGFVGAFEVRVNAAKKAYSRFLSVSPKAAAAWRDISVLTPEVVAQLSAYPPKTFAPAIENLADVAAAVHGDQITISGVNKRCAKDTLDSIEALVRNAYATVSRLYEDIPTKYPRIELTTMRRSPSGPASDSDRDEGSRVLIYIASPKLRGLKKDIEGEGSFRSRVFLGNQFNKFTEATSARIPKFIVSYLGDNVRDTRTPNSINLYVRHSATHTGQSRISEDISRLPPPAVVIDVPRNMNERALQSATYNTLRNALVTILLELSERPYSPMDAGVRFFIQSRGTGPRPLLDSWCQLYSRLWHLDLIDGHGIRPTDAQSEFIDDSGEELLERMFPTLSPVSTHDRRLLAGSGGRIAAALLSSPGTKDQKQKSYRRTVSALLTSNGWAVSNFQHVTSPDTADHFNLEYQENKNFEHQLDQSELLSLLERSFKFSRVTLSSVRTISLSETAGPNDILTRLYTDGNLLATMRDLSLCNPEIGGVGSILAAQTRRFANTLPSSWRSMYFRELINTSLSQSKNDSLISGRVNRFISSKDFGHKYFLLCRKVVFDRNFAVAYFETNRKSALNDRRRATTKTEETKFFLVFDRQGLHITGDTQFRDGR